MKDICLMFVVYQPPYEHNRKRPFAKNYFQHATMCINTLLRTRFPSEKVLCICKSEEHADKINKKFSIRTMIGPELPLIYQELVKKNPDAYYFYKPVAYYHVMPRPVDDNTVMSFCDVDALFKKNPYSLLQGLTTDVWAMRGTSLPHRFRKNPPKRYYNPRLTYEDLKEFYYMQGGGAIAHLQMEYKFPLPKQNLFTGWVAIQPHVYEKLIALWYEMCCKVVTRPDLEKGDQEIFSAAVWKLGLSHVRASKVIKGWCTQYGGLGKKTEMLRDYSFYKNMIDERNERLRKKGLL